ncbi:right-handed parallel beta-helix repeat-containing protein, partial [Rhizobium ruizarguesonis]
DCGAIKMMGEQADPLNSTIRSNLVTGTGHLMNRVDGTFWPPGYENTSEWPSPISWAIYTDGKASGLRIEGNTLSGNVAAIGI